MVAKMSSFDKNDKIMIASLPAKGIITIYSVIGDIFIYLLIGYLIIYLFIVFRLGELTNQEKIKIKKSIHVNQIYN
jgi:hypothetical protein